MIGSFIGSEHQETFAAADCRHMPHPASAPLRGHPAQRQTGAAAFSLVDLLTLIGVLVLLGLLLTPALAHTRVSDQSFQCMHNLRQLSNVSVYHCPADVRPLKLADGESASDPALRGRKIPNARTVSMNLAVGTNPYLGGRLPVDGASLDGHNTNTRNGPWFTGLLPKGART